MNVPFPPAPHALRAPARVEQHGSHSRWVPAAVLIAIAVSLSGAASAEKPDRDKPINFGGDKVEANYDTKVATLVGNAIITQGTLTIRADKIVFHQNPDNSLSATVYGNPLSFREKRDGVNEYYEAFAQRAEYDGVKHLLELFDRALLKKGTDEIRSNYISYNTETEFFKAEGRPDAKGVTSEVPLAGRVRGVFQPPAKDAAAKTGKGGADKDSDKPADPLPLKTDPGLNSERAK